MIYSLGYHCQDHHIGRQKGRLPICENRKAAGKNKPVTLIGRKASFVNDKKIFPGDRFKEGRSKTKRDNPGKVGSINFYFIEPIASHCAANWACGFLFSLCFVNFHCQPYYLEKPFKI